MSRRSFFLLIFLASGSVLTAITIATPTTSRRFSTRSEPVLAAMVPLTLARFGAHTLKH